MNFSKGDTHDLGSIRFSEEEIIQFAKKYDPLEFHINREAALKSIFKGYVASGPHAFHYFYTQKWIPLFGKTVLAGLEMNHWQFLKPIYPNQQIYCSAYVEDVVEFPEKKSAVVNWKFELKNDNGELFQHLNMKVLHKTIQP